MTLVANTRCYTPIKGRTLRIVTLDVCGNPITGTGSAQVITAGFTKVDSKAQYENGDEYIVKTADAQLCVNEKDPDILKRLELTVSLCTIDPGMVANTISPARLLTFSESPTGTGFALQEGAAGTHFSLEVWQRVSGAGACDPSGQQRYVYNAWPHCVNAKIGDYGIQADPAQLEYTCETKAVGSLWTVGNAWLGAGAVSPANADHWFQNLTLVAPPTPLCGVYTYP
jgi:hypothetical protein